MKSIWGIVLLFSVFVLLVPNTLASTLGQWGGESYVVQADDWLSKVAEKYYDDASIWPAIWLATNTKATRDSDFTSIADPNLIDVGQKLWLPSEEEVERFLQEYNETNQSNIDDSQSVLNFQPLKVGIFSSYFVTVEEVADKILNTKTPQSDPILLEIDNQTDFEEFWFRDESNRYPEGPQYVEFPTINFDREVVLALVDHGEPSGGFGIQVDSVIETEQSIVINARKTTPGNCPAIAVITQPYTIIKILKNEKPYTLSLVVDHHNCQ